MLAIDVGIGHQDDLVIAQLGNVEVLADPRPESRDHGLDFRVAQCLVQPRALHVQDLAAQRQDGLGLGVPPTLGRTAGGVTLHEVDLAARRILGGAVGQLARHAEGFQGTLPPCIVARLPGRHAGLGCRDSLADHVAGRARVSFQPVTKLIGDNALDEPLDLGVAQFGLGLALELGFGQA